MQGFMANLIKKYWTDSTLQLYHTMGVKIFMKNQEVINEFWVSKATLCVDIEQIYFI